MNKFARWMEENEKQQNKVAQKVGISSSFLNDLIHRGKKPSIKIAFEIEKYTKGEITVYDWLD